MENELSHCSNEILCDNFLKFNFFPGHFTFLISWIIAICSLKLCMYLNLNFKFLVYIGDQIIGEVRATDICKFSPDVIIVHSFLNKEWFYF